jgi:hypothetical protein
MLVQALTAFKAAWSKPGAIGLSTSAMNATWIWVAEIPMSPAGAAVVEPAADGFVLDELDGDDGVDEIGELEDEHAASVLSIASTASSTQPRRMARLFT